MWDPATHVNAVTPEFRPDAAVPRLKAACHPNDSPARVCCRPASSSSRMALSVRCWSHQAITALHVISCVQQLAERHCLLVYARSCVPLQKRKAAAAGGDSDGAAADSEDDFEEAPAAKRGGSKNAPASRGSKAAAAASGGSKYGPKVEKLRRMCRAAGITIGPSVYVKVRAAAGAGAANSVFRLECRRAAVLIWIVMKLQQQQRYMEHAVTKCRLPFGSAMGVLRCPCARGAHAGMRAPMLTAEACRYCSCTATSSL